MSPNGLVTPGPGAYNKEFHLDKMFAQTGYFRTKPNDVRHQREAAIVHPGGLPYETTGPRLVDLKP